MEKFARILHRITQTVSIMFPIIPFGLAMQLILQKSILLLLAALALAIFSAWISRCVIDLWFKLTFELGCCYAGRRHATIIDYVRNEFPILWKHSEAAFVTSVIIATSGLLTKDYYSIVNRTTFCVMVALAVVFVLAVSLSYVLYRVLYWQNGVDGNRYVPVNSSIDQEGVPITEMRSIKEIRQIVHDSLSHKVWRPS